MSERQECVAAVHALQRAVVGVSGVGLGLEEALTHVRTCAFCGRRFELVAVRAFTEARDTVPAMADCPVDPTALFERAFTEALSEREAIARRHAVEQIGDRQLGPAALGALVRAAADDRDETVRKAALAALEGLGQVTLLRTEEGGAWNRLTVSGESGSLGEIVRREDQLWMKLNRLPGAFEKTKPVVAVPAALEAGEAQIEWSGETPGLVFASDAVAEGALEVYLGNVAGRASHENLFTRVYLLNPGKRSRGSL